MRPRWLLVLASLLLTLSCARAQPAGSFFPDPDVPGRYTSGATFGFSSLPAGFSDTVLFTAPVDGALTIDLAFRPIVGTNVVTGMFQLVRLDDDAPFSLTGSASHVTLGPVDIAAGAHELEIIAAVPFPHGVSIPGPAATAFDLSLTLTAVPAIPEPDTWVLMLGGMAVLGWVAARRRARHLAALALAGASLCAVAQTKPGDTIFSDNFDSAPLGVNQTSLPGGWVVTDGTIDVIGAPGFDPRPGHGHYIDLQGSSGQPGHLSIEMPIPVSGIYLVEFEWSGNPRGNSGAIELVGEPQDPRTGGFGIAFNVPADQPFVQGFHSTGIINQGSLRLTWSTPSFVDPQEGPRVFPDTGLLLDNVSVRFIEAIPEPGTAALIGAGLALIVAGRRWRAAA